MTRGHIHQVHVTVFGDLVQLSGEIGQLWSGGQLLDNAVQLDLLAGEVAALLLQRRQVKAQLLRLGLYGLRLGTNALGPRTLWLYQQHEAGDEYSHTRECREQ